MLSFLKECDNQLYQRALNIENQLKIESVVVEMQSFFHVALKNIYDKIKDFTNLGIIKYNSSSIEVSPTLSQLYRNKSFKTFVEENLKFDDWDTLRDLDLDATDYLFHSVKNVEDNKIRDYFKLIFTFSKCYVEYMQDIILDNISWNDNEYNKLLKKDSPNKKHNTENNSDDDLFVNLFGNIFEDLTDDPFGISNLTDGIFDDSEDDIFDELTGNNSNNFNIINRDKKSEKFDYKELAKKFSDHYCNEPNCTSKLIPKRTWKNTWFWSCNRYPKCKGSADMDYADALKCEECFSSFNDKKNDNIKGEIFYSSPDSLLANPGNTYYFQSLGLPNSIFKDTIFNDTLKNDLVKYSKFSINYKIKPTNKINETLKLIYSLLLRIFNRGIISPEPQMLEEVLIKHFGTGSTNSNILFDYVKYDEKIEIPFDSIREFKFLKTTLVPILGNAWSSYIIPQCDLSLLVNAKDKSKVVDERVDFFVCKNNKGLVIELDGIEHKNHKINDATRNSMLKNNGISVLRIPNFLIDKKQADDAISKINATINSDSSCKIGINQKVLVSTKIIHQICIALTKALEQGFISEKSNIQLSIVSDLFDENETNYLLNKATNFLSRAISHMANIYGIKINPIFNSTDVSPIKILIGTSDNENRNIEIRDISIPFDFTLKLDGFNANILPKQVLEDDARFFLSYIFGFNEFREGQFESIKRTLLRKDSIILLPTGAGKSIIYQLSSFLAPGLIVVVSPLRALMRDQIDNLKAYGIDLAIAIYSSPIKNNLDRSGVSEQQKILVNNNSLSLLYLAPERLQIKDFRSTIQTVLKSNIIFSIAIDEAHCISEWGHEFRTSYLNISKISKELFKTGDFYPSLIALTGTASDAVLKDVKRELHISDINAILRPKDFNRPELNFAIYDCTSINKIPTLSRIISQELPGKFGIDESIFFAKNDEKTYSGIVFTPFVGTRKNGSGNYSVVSIEQGLNRFLPNCEIGCYGSKRPYSIKMSDEDWAKHIAENAEKFKKNKINLLVSTKAFGMGVDKSNIRYTIHNGLPQSIEEYYQEAGRAGRNKELAICSIIFSNDNVNFNEELLNPNLSLDDLKKKYDDSKNQIIDDDLTAMLYFHTNSFPGLTEELEIADKVLSKLNFNSNFTNIQTIGFRNEVWKNENLETKIEKTIQRLLVLGVIEDYTYDYSKKEYEVTINKIDNSKILDYYIEYVKNYSRGRIVSEREKLEKYLHLNRIDFLKKSLGVLISFVYDNIEKGRRRAIQEMFNLSQKAIKLPEADQGEYIRNRIVDYFDVANATEIVKILRSKNAGLKESFELFELYKDKVNKNKEQEDDALSLKGQIGRALSSNADHPGLLLARVMADIKSNDYNINSVINDIAAACKFGIDRYSINPKNMQQTLIPVINLFYNASANAFKKLMEQLSKSINIFELYELLIENKDINDSLRDEAIIGYFEYKINQFLEV